MSKYKRGVCLSSFRFLKYVTLTFSPKDILINCNLRCILHTISKHCAKYEYYSSNNERGVHVASRRQVLSRVKSGIFEQTAKFGQPPSLYHSSIIEIENKLTKQTVKILMDRLIWISTVWCKCVSELTWCRIYPTLHLTLNFDSKIISRVTHHKQILRIFDLDI